MGYGLYSQYSMHGDQNLNYEYNIHLPDKQFQLKLEALCSPMVFAKELIIANGH
jgi:hypothetical protein